MNARERLQNMIRTEPGDMTVWDQASVRNALDAYRAEVRDEAAEDIHRAELPQFAATENPVMVAKNVRAIDVRLAERGTQAPYGVKKGDQPAAPDFFQLGHTYKHEAWTFRCDTITTHPDTGERTVLGWFRFRTDSWRPLSCGEAEWAEGVWTDITTEETR